MENGGRPALHHPIPGNMWTEGLSTADRPQKKKKTSPVAGTSTDGEKTFMSALLLPSLCGRGLNRSPGLALTCLSWKRARMTEGSR